MSELAFDGNGEPIVFPANAEELRVRRFRNPGMRGACEVVHERDGAPLYVPVDTTYVEFRGLVDSVPGRYRLDPVDAGRQIIGNTAPAYVTITEPMRNGAGPGVADDRDSVIRELARANAEMTTTIADRFASVMQAAAELLRAADGAGLPRREPAAPAIDTHENRANEDDQGAEDEEEDEDEAPDIASLIAQVLPMIQMWLAARTAEKTAVAPPAAASPSAPDPRPVSAPSAAPDATGEVGAAAGPEPTARATEEVAGSSTPRPLGTRDGHVRNARRAWSPAEMDHLLAVYAGLSSDEKRIAQVVVARMAPELRAQWLGELSAMTVEQAVGLVRSMIPRDQRRRESDS